MTSVGETLRRERLKRNLELDAISRELKIPAKLLEAIEEERFDQLPRGVFAKSFVRQYARLLGLDEDELGAEVQRAIEPPAAMPSLAEKAPQTGPVEIHVPKMEAWEHVSDTRSSQSSSLPALAMVVVAMLVCSGVYALWQRLHRPGPPRDETVQATQAQPSRLSHNQPDGSAAPPSAVPPVQTPAQSSAQVQPPPTQPTTPAPNPPAAVTPPATAPADSASRVPAPPANPNAPVRVDVTAGELVWVLARSDGKYSFSGTLEANQTRTFDGNGTVLLRLGNAGGVSIRLNGQPIPAVGPKGQVRTVQFTSGGFQIVAAPKPSLPLDDLL